MLSRKLVLGCLAVLGAGSELFAQDATPAELLFVRRIAPLFREKCVACHGQGPGAHEGGLQLVDARGVQSGGERGEPLLRPEHPEQSPLYLAVSRQSEEWSAMPPKEAERLSAEQLAWLRDWIAGGAPWPDDARRKALVQLHAAEWSREDGVMVVTSGGQSEEWNNRAYRPESLWAYQPVLKPTIAVAEGQSEVDVLLAARRPPELIAAAPADRPTWLRRVTFSLTGLPPTPEELEDFVNDARADIQACESVIDRLLASPHYGERMAQHWLDVARYADSSGFANDYERGNAWRYRDYVVRAFNNDKPFDQFILEQIAGDELRPDDPEGRIATGFLRMGPWELTGMEVAKVARQRFLDDVTNSVGETFLAHSLQCARCHDHKFDPIPTRDYYSLQAVFATTQLAEAAAPFLPAENLHGFDERKYLVLQRQTHEQTLARLDQVLLDNAERWFEKTGADPAAWREAVVEVTKQYGAGAGGRFDAARRQMSQRKLPEDQYPSKLLGFTTAEFGADRVARKGLERLRWEFERYEPYALAVYSGRTPDLKTVYQPLRPDANRLTAGELEQTCILPGGDPFGQGEPVTPGVLSALSATGATNIPTAIEGRRLAFARWVAHPANALTTRTIVNRVWMWHFVQPLAGNPNNFGSTGKRPTHPELLDWLAATFVEDGWSLKALQRRILNTAAYRRSSDHPEPARLAELDPLHASDAAFLPRRLTAEELRDAALAATGELNPTLGGIPVRPEINQEAALQPRQVMGSFAAAWTPNPRPEQRHRRSLYTLKLRGLPDPQREVVNEPGPDFSCERREATTVTPQVFALLNSQQSHARALALAHAVHQRARSDEAAIEQIYQRLMCRSPTTRELARLTDHWKAAMGQQGPPPEPLVPPLSVKRQAVEENTGEYFSFDEALPALAEFVPDLQPHQVDSKTRALAEICLALLNSNEFVYVY